jgi:two-component system NtrC family sensor kinase
LSTTVNQFVEKLLSPVSTQGQLSVAFFQVSAFVILLVLYLILYKDVKARFLRFWVVGWALLTCGAITRLAEQLYDSRLESSIVQVAYFLAVSFMLAAVLEYLRPFRELKRLWLLAILGSVAVGAMSVFQSPDGFFLWRWAPAMLTSGITLSAGWILWRVRKRLAGHGISLMASALLLAGLHHLDRPFWSGQQFYSLRMAFGSLLQVALGIGMVVLILEASHSRVEELNDKLRRLTLIAAASTQTLSVDEVLKVVLENLVESLGATHGVVRLLTGEGETAELTLRAVAGLDSEYAKRYARIPADELWARTVLQQSVPWVCHLQEDAPTELRERMLSNGISTMVYVRLPGKDAPIGVLGIASASRRRFQPDEIDFIVNVATLVGLTIQNLRLFETAAAAERQWSYTFDSIEDPILVHDIYGRVIRANQSLAARLGKTPEKLYGRMITEILRREGSAWSTCPYCEGNAGKGDTPDPGLGGYLLVSNSDFHDPAGHRLGVVHVLKDITDRQQAQEKYRRLIVNMQEGVFISSPEGRFLDFNDAFQRMLGYESREELLAVNDIASSMYVNAGDRLRLQKLLKDHGAVNDFEFQMRRRDGEIVTLLESSVVTRDTSGKIEAFQGFVLDITERKNAEQEIRRRNRELMILNSIGQTLNQPIELEELLGRALRQVVELFGADAGSIFLMGGKTSTLKRVAASGLRTDYARAFPDTDLPEDFLAHIRAVHATVLSAAGLPLPAVFRDFQQKEGLQVLHFVLLWSKDRPLGCMLLGSREVRDFSNVEMNLLISVSNQIAASIEKILLLDETRQAYDNLRHTQEQLLQSEKMAAVGQLISGVAHELNNPLTAILGYSQLLSSKNFVNEQGADYVDKLYKQARRTHRIVNNLLSFARQQKPERLPVRINQVIEDTLALREYDLRINNIHIHRDLEKNLPLTGADAQQLQQVFLNILNNAVDAILERSDRGDIWVRTSQGDRCIVAEFVDSGPGMLDTHRVFDPFYTTKPVGKGTGLGLSICYGIISEHGGQISVKNAAGQGASVSVSLPVSPVSSSSDNVETAHSDDVPVLGRVLLVDDEESLLELECEILQSRRLTVLTARSGKEAIEVLEQATVDLVVTDMKMPGEITGRALYEWIREHRPALANRVVFTMSDSSDQEARDLFESSGCPHVQKPFEVDSFWRIVQRSLLQQETAIIKR